MKIHRKNIDGFESTSISGNYDDYKDDFEDMLPAIKRQFKKKGVPFPDDPWELLDVVLLRRAEGSEESLEFDDFLEAGMKIWEERGKKIDARKAEQNKQLSSEVTKRVDTFCKRRAPRKTKQAQMLLKVLEIILKERPGYRPLKNIAGTIREIKDYEEYDSNGLEQVSYESEKKWIKEYLKERNKS